MDPQRVFTLNLVGLMLAALIAGLLVHRRDRLCRSFLAYAVAVFVGDRLIVGWPEAFDTWSFWILKESAYWALKVSIAAEIGLRTFSQLPRARRILVVVGCVVTATAVVVQLMPAAHLPGDHIPWVSAVAPRGQAAVLVLLGAVAALVVYYRPPVHPFHRAILLGLVLYLIVYTGSLTILRQIGAPAYRLFVSLDPAAYAATVGVWLWAAWRPAYQLSPGARLLQPWATSSW